MGKLVTFETPCTKYDHNDNDDKLHYSFVPIADVNVYTKTKTDNLRC